MFHTKYGLRTDYDLLQEYELLRINKSRNLKSEATRVRRSSVVNGYWQDDGVRDWSVGEPPGEQSRGARQTCGSPHSYAPLGRTRLRGFRLSSTQPCSARYSLASLPT